MADLNPFLLAAQTPDPDPRLLPLLHSHPNLASLQDSHGYSLLHAASSYNHLTLLKSLITDFQIDINLLDEDNETCLFVAETFEMAKLLVETHHIDTSIVNNDGQTALQKFESEDEYPEIIAFLRTHSGEGIAAGQNGRERLPPLPPNVSINVNTQTEQDGVNGQEPDPVFRRRIEELAAKENFQTEDGQRELRELVTDAVRNVSGENERGTRRRVT